MFKKGEQVRIEMTDPTDPGSLHYAHGTVVEFQFPLLKLNDGGKETTFNMSSPLIVKAEKRN